MTSSIAENPALLCGDALKGHLDLVRVQALLVSVVQELSPEERRRRRESLGWSKAQAARWLGVAPSTFDAYEAGKVLPRWGRLYLYAEFLQLASESSEHVDPVAV